jgi:hypothetical protein
MMITLLLKLRVNLSDNRSRLHVHGREWNAIHDSNIIISEFDCVVVLFISNVTLEIYTRLDWTF